MAQDQYELQRGVLVARNQGKSDGSLNQLMTIQCLPAPPTSALTSTAQFTFDIPCGNLQMVSDMRLRLDVLEASAASMILCPAPYMVQRMEWQDMQGNVFYKAFNDTLFFNACSVVELQKQNQAFLQSLNVSDRYYEGYQHPPSSTRIYRIPLVGHPFSIREQFLGNLNKLRLVIYWSGSVVSSGSGTTSLSNVYLELNHRRLPADQLAIQRNYFHTKKVTRILQPDLITLSGQTLTASTKALFDLSAFRGKFPFFIVAVRSANNSATDNGYLKTLALGGKGTIDIESPTGQTLYSDGASPKVHLLQEDYSSHFQNKNFSDFRRWYLISFCSSCRSAMAGIENGYLRLDGSKYNLAITPDAAKVDTVQTITLTSTSVQTQGAFLLQFRGNQTIPLAYNASAATIQTALNNLPEMKNWPGGPMTATVSAAFSASAAPTITLNAKGGPCPNEDINLISFDNVNSATSTTAASVDSATTTVSTFGQPGWTTGSNYVVDIYGYKQRWMTEYEGMIKVVDDV